MKIKKMKHNKKRNTAFLYESLIKELTLSIVNRDERHKKIVESILYKFFKKGTCLNQDLDSYKALYDVERVSPRNAERLLFEAQAKRKTINKKNLFNEQTKLIDSINKKLGKQAFGHYISSYKHLATISQIFNNVSSVKSRVLLENEVIKEMVSEGKSQSPSKSLDKTTYKIFSKSFNKKYGNHLLPEQKKVIQLYLLSSSDNHASLKMFLEEEIVFLCSRSCQAGK